MQGILCIQILSLLIEEPFILLTIIPLILYFFSLLLFEYLKPYIFQLLVAEGFDLVEVDFFGGGAEFGFVSVMCSLAGAI